MRESVTYQAILEEGEAKGRSEGLSEGLSKGLSKGRSEGLSEGLSEGRAEGRMEEARLLILRLGGKRFGAVSPENRAAIESVVSVERLEELVDRLLEVESWEELLTIS